MSLLLSRRIVSAATRRTAALHQTIEAIVVIGGAHPAERYGVVLSSLACNNSGGSTISHHCHQPFQMQQIRFKHAAKKGLHLQRLDEMAHSSEREAAEERRKKKKEHTAARKGKKDAETASATNANATGSNSSHHDDDWDEQPEEEQEEDKSVLPDPAAVKNKMLTHVAGFKEYLKGVRSGEPTAELFDGIMVTDAYGSGTGAVPLKSVAQIVISSPTLAVATCFDPATSKAVSVAIRNKLELNPQTEEGGGTIKIPIPRVSMELRQQTAASVQKRAENYRQRIRKNRRAAMDVVKQGEAGKLEGVSKDDAFRVHQEIEAITEAAINELNQVAEKKHNDIMAV